ncbi:MAG: BadF/BadG/BcrA/BcrD ATPase family protein [Bacteroidota bacterium]|nr:BadF/BadG/BcrA/BcrD ATPase family protein [Bacteroidota bacterium]MDP4229308.1 BadF/BadG/BcrA/BcrD ATPase family protein [Bacteroidota bacterium]MDP4234867.1 BadF/BadG/BcrA/BcrD ATPase family protein [Bacteroidota bacterium]
MNQIMTSDSIFVGFDGGGSTSRFIVARKNGEPSTHVFAQNLKYTDLGIQESAKELSKCLRDILGDDVTSCRSICISLSGASNQVANAEFISALRDHMQLQDLKIHIESDSSFALKTAYPNDESGMVLIAGTGSVAIARKKNGDIVKVGGWGRLLGDEGSGYWIGLQALKQYCKASDANENQGELFIRVEEVLQTKCGSDFAAIRRMLYQNELHPQDFAQLVFEYSDKDLAAKSIIEEAINALKAILFTLFAKVKEECNPTVTLHGTIARHPEIAGAIAEDCRKRGLQCRVLSEEAVLQKALEVSMQL